MDRLDLISTFKYEDGKVFRHKVTSGPKTQTGEAGYLWKSKKWPPRWKVKFSGKTFFRSRVVWIMHNGEIPDGMDVDHIDGDQLNDRVENLRLATRQQNCFNRSARKDSKTGVKGVYLCTRSGMFCSQLMVDGKRKHLGYFDSIQGASNAYLEASRKFQGEYACRRW